MTSLPPWAEDPDLLTLTEAQYDELPDHVRKLIEVIDGNVIFCPSGTPEHGDVTRTLAIRLDGARPAQPCTRVSTGVDVHFTKRRRSGTVARRDSHEPPGIPGWRCSSAHHPHVSATRQAPCGDGCQTAPSRNNPAP
jgi:hypothetical protein